jgi:hypothetical protein
MVIERAAGVARAPLMMQSPKSNEEVQAKTLAIIQLNRNLLIAKAASARSGAVECVLEESFGS